MKIAVVGAGVAGLVHARMLRAVGFEVVVFEKAPDVGGVWSATRRYPGLRTQNTKKTYRFSDQALPTSVPECPSSAQVQSYLADYASRHRIDECLRLGTEVEHAAWHDDHGWTLRLRTQGRRGDGGRSTEQFDHLIVANGVFQQPNLPDLPGRAAFEAAGGRVCHSSEFHDLELARGRNVVVVGYGKSACDLAVAVSEVATSTTVVARRLLWKMPPRLVGLFDFEGLELTRQGEAGFLYLEPNRIERFLHGPARLLSDAIFRVLQRLTTRQLGLRELGLVPHGRFEDISDATESLATEGFFDQVRRGRLDVRRDRSLVRFDPAGAVELTDGGAVAADLVVFATGFRQDVPFLAEEIRRQVVDEQGNFRLYRNIAPIGVPGLTFAGYNSSGISMLSAEVGALWTTHLLTGQLVLPPDAQLRATVEKKLRWLDERTDGRFASGASVTPFAIHNIDEMLGDLNMNLSAGRRFLQWFVTVRPGDYQRLLWDRLPGDQRRGDRRRGARPAADQLPADSRRTVA
ncbi:flavin-containing monooxygenase [Skermania piniformis]|uniref:NAD(P)/FAD-dependent oxidoreductase n=1 Tax=Skermania pinensis TaxID=39122 RepID=A0ABX8S3V6_9ACTN|nr:NAD(P)/FAD-dependent oxidoreductase [Skermania piniformis]QXQ12403.1 NAD(P)/FAD-dependent oxidoreductase [Skermania piniformis]